jgi:hypothetical protein
MVMIIGPMKSKAEQKQKARQAEATAGSGE